jgi:acyl-CoA reductase-like NAD-dependent aldehyde dehydrogenase
MMISNRARTGTASATIRSPYDGREVGTHPLGSAEDIDAALSANVEAAEACRRMPAYERAASLRRVADGIEKGADAFIALLSREAGKPLAQSKLEIERAAFVFRDAAEE